MFRLNPRYLTDKSMLSGSSLGAAAMTCRLTHNKEPLGVQLSSMLDSSNFGEFMGHARQRSSSGEKRLQRRVLEKRSTSGVLPA